jgi:hypothetical protein
VTTISLPVTFVEGPLDPNSLNAQFSAVLSALNSLQASVEDLQADSSPVDLSGYATVAQLNAHLADTTPHAGMMAWTAGTALAGSDYVEGNQLKVQAKVVTLSGGAGTVTYDSALLNGVLSIQCTVIGSSGHSASADTITLTSAAIHGTSDNQVHVLVVGW